MKNASGYRQLSALLSLRTPRPSIIALSGCLFAGGVGASGAQTNSSVSQAQTAPACANYGGWMEGKTGQPFDRGEFYRDLVAKNGVVLLGESHTDADHHRVQLQTLAALHSGGAKLVIGFEAFPRRLQSVLDDWVDGKLTEEAFLKAAE